MRAYETAWQDTDIMPRGGLKYSALRSPDPRLRAPRISRRGSLWVDATALLIVAAALPLMLFGLSLRGSVRKVLRLFNL